jgi:hypothetical protein
MDKQNGLHSCNGESCLKRKDILTHGWNLKTVCDMGQATTKSHLLHDCTYTRRLQLSHTQSGKVVGVLAGEPVFKGFRASVVQNEKIWRCMQRQWQEGCTCRVPPSSVLSALCTCGFSQPQILPMQNKITPVLIIYGLFS